MFEQTFVQTQAQTRRPWTVAVSLSAQCGLIAIVLLIPLLHPEKLPLLDAPKARPISTWVNLPLTPQPVHASAHAPAIPSPARGRQLVYVPTTRPDTARLTDVAPIFDSAPTEWGGSPSTLPSSMALSNVLPVAVPVKPLAPPTPVAPAGPRRVGGDVAAARLQFGPRPAYPQIAITTRTQGTVKLEAIIATDGSIKNLRLLSGQPLLVKAAMDAVAQWKYQPTLLNGVAVEVLTEISVNFSLGH